MKNITIEAKSTTTTWSGDAIQLYSQSFVRLDNVNVVNCGGNGIYCKDVWDSVFFQVFLNGCGTYGTLTQAGRLKGITGTGGAFVPSIAAGPGPGTGGTSVTIAGSNVAGRFTIQTSTSTFSASSVIATITYGLPYFATAPFMWSSRRRARTPRLCLPRLSPSSGASNFTLTVGTAALSSKKTYRYQYHAIQ